MEENLKIYKKDLYSVLFSKYSKTIRRLNYIAGVVLILETLAFLFGIDIFSNHFHESFKKHLWFILMYFINLVYVLTGYIWLGRSKMQIKRQIWWFYLMLGIGFVHMGLSFALPADKIGYLPLFWLIYVIINLIFSIRDFFRKPKDKHFFIRTLSIWINLIQIPIIVIIFTLTAPLVYYSNALMVFVILLSCVLGVFIVFKFLFKDKKTRLILENMESIKPMILAILIGSAVFAMYVLISKLFVHGIFGAVSLAVGGLQVIITLIFWKLIRYKKNDFESDFVKSFILSLSIMIQLMLVVIAKEGQSIVSSDNADIYYLNIVLSGMSITLLTYVTIKYKISRDQKYKILDSLQIFIFTVALITLSLLEDTTGLALLNLVPVDEIIIYFSALCDLITLLLMGIDWWKSMNKRNEEKIWN